MGRVRAREIFFWDAAGLGRLYAATTAFLGFKVQEGEYEVLGLAAMGTPKHASYLVDNVVVLRMDGGFWVKPYFFDYHFSASMVGNTHHA